ncbi:MAG: glycosyltransferase family 9 protein [Alphaproteobacteria bacterium]
MKVLFITSSRLGDAVLSTGLLGYITQTYPGARVTIVAGPMAAPLFDGYPNLERIIPLEKHRYSLHWARLWRQVAGTRWDIVVDMRNSAVSRLISARQRCIMGAQVDSSRHKVEQAAQVMKLETVPAPCLWFTQGQKNAVERLIPAGEPVLGVGPAANWQGKMWPAENFMVIIRHIIGPGGILPGARVAVFAAPGEEDIARGVLESVPRERQIDMIGKADAGIAAAALARCAFYIGNDSGLMHTAAAAGVPTLGLFGPSYPHLYRPWGAHADYVSTPESYDELTAYDDYNPATAPSLMHSLSVESVKESLEQFRFVNTAKASS